MDEQADVSVTPSSATAEANPPKTMSSTSSSLPTTANTANGAETSAVATADDLTPEPTTAAATGGGGASYEVVRRRRRRRRRRREVEKTPQQRLHYALLCIVGLLLVASVFGESARHQAMQSIRHLIPNVAVDLSRRLEVVALVIAGAILVYLTPGVEDKVLRALGLRRDHRRGGNARRR